MKAERYGIDELNKKLIWDNADVSNKYKKHICIALSLLDKEIVDKVLREVYFITCDREQGLHIPIKEMQEKGKTSIIFLSETMLNLTEELFEPKNTIKVILHEIGHFYLGHKTNIDLTEEETARQEKEADEFAFKWLKELSI